MAANRTVTVQIPAADYPFFRSVVRQMGWKTRLHKEKKSGLELALEDVAEGRVNSYDSPEQFYEKLGI